MNKQIIYLLCYGIYRHNLKKLTNFIQLTKKALRRRAP
jgi:hypothetical protein